MKLTDLAPQFLRISRRQKQGLTYLEVDEFAKAKGITFTCPKCLKANKGDFAVTHTITCWSPSISPAIAPAPIRWTMTGTGYDDLTLDPEIRLAGCGWQGRVVDGEVSDIK